MHKQQLTISHYVSDTIYCDLCRFCKITKGGTTCLLSNELLYKDAHGVLKSKSCLTCRKGLIEDNEVQTTLPKAAVKSITQQVLQQYKSYVKQGYPSSLAIEMATKNVAERD